VYLQLVKAYRIIIGRQRDVKGATIHDIRIMHDSPYFIVVDKAADVLMNSGDRSVKGKSKICLVVLTVNNKLLVY
jgi:hypothetical protein